MRYDGNAAIDGHGFQVHVGPNKPHSRGRVQFVPKNPGDKPSILFNYLVGEPDREDLRLYSSDSRDYGTSSPRSVSGR
ncbi:hypothetical protein ND16A_3512 [Thalassotalea sp. ND16A]|nr:hypothetical protein ND16A_3512 [Thalassotalea sp. ND16A]